MLVGMTFSEPWNFSRRLVERHSVSDVNDKTECCCEARFREFFRRVLQATFAIFMYGYCSRVFYCVISSLLLGLSEEKCQHKYDGY